MDIFPTDRAQLYAMAASGELSGSVTSLDQFYARLKPREMTREDLGLETHAERSAAIHKWLLETNAVYCRMVMGDAPYAFWLGADA